MVKVKEQSPFTDDGHIDIEQWLNQMSAKGYAQDLELLRTACQLSQLTGANHATETGQSCLQQGLAMADILSDMEVDQDTLAAAIIYNSVHDAELSLEVVEEQLGLSIARLVRGIEKMNAISNLQALTRYPQSKHQIDNIRKMLIAMVDDVRVVLIKLAERLCVLRACTHLPAHSRQHIATEAMEIYAPLANRLGIGAVKWEMEDLGFRYLCPEEYRIIAKGLNAKRLERDRFVNLIVSEINTQLATLDIQHFAVYGRSKHIHSIYRKMQRKKVSLEEIYDATAVRILVETNEQCYEVLSMIHATWQQVPAEFDDYIVNPKANGYQSLHTAVTGPEGRVFEVQIRTFQMHTFAEMGVAAHWKYKEGHTKTKESHERKIEWLREVLAWHKEMAAFHGISEALETEFLEDRVYVFTPDWDVVDLPVGVTPLDFAYHVHSEVGHCCRGAKVNGHIVPLTYQLQTSDRVEILTGKEAKPSRDWLNPHLNYLTTSKAKAKVAHWFRMQDFDKDRTLGYEMLDKELKALNIKTERLQEVLTAFNFKRLDDLFAAVGRNDLRVGQILNRLTPAGLSEASPLPPFKVQTPPLRSSGGGLLVEGIGSLLTHMARCCQPVPGDKVIGYITLGRGISVHRQNCPNILHCSEKQQQRLLEIKWNDAPEENYMVDIKIKALDHATLLKEVTALLAIEKAHVYALNTQTNKRENITYLTLTVEIEGVAKLSQLIHKLNQIPNVLEARRQF